VPPYEPLTVSEETHGEIMVLRCAGEIDIATVSLLRDRLSRVQAEGAARLVLELEAVTFLDSLGLGALISAHKRAGELAGSMVIVTTSRPVLRVLSATALDQVFTVVSTLDEALGR
jgi:anti-sigma B factor antagonist